MEATEKFSLKGKTAIVTGGTTGLGLAITKCMVEAGAKVVALSFEDAAAGKAALQPFAGQAVFYQYDVTKTEEAPGIVEKIIAEQGAIDILVNNAGNHCKKPIEEMTVADYEAVLDVHLVGAFALTKAVYPHLKEHGGGSILFQASMTSFIGQPQVAGYATAKAGYLGLMRTIAVEGGPYNVRANCIAPGWIDTAMYRKAIFGDQVRENKILGRIPLQHVGTPEDIGNAAVFLCTPAAKYITGVCLPVDGGGVIGF